MKTSIKSRKHCNFDQAFSVPPAGKHGGSAEGSVTVVVVGIVGTGEAEDGDEVGDVDDEDEHVDPPGGVPLELQVRLDERVGEEALLLGQDDDLDRLEHGARVAAPQLGRLREEHAEVEDDPPHDLLGARPRDQAFVQQPLHGVGRVPENMY